MEDAEKLLNPALYRALEKLFGTVFVVDAGAPAEYTKEKLRVALLKSRSHVNVLSWGEAYAVNCPECENENTRAGDRKHRLYFSHVWGSSVVLGRKKKEVVSFGTAGLAVCHHHHCRFEGSRWAAALRKELGLQQKRNNQYITQRPRKLTAKNLPVELALPPETLPLTTKEAPISVLNYLRVERGFDPAELARDYHLRVVLAGSELWRNEQDEVFNSFDDRIVVPVYCRRRLVGWQARLARKAVGNDRKYLFPPKMKKNRMLYNMDTAWRHLDIAIVEGVTDVWRIGELAVALFGRCISREQIRIAEILWGWKGQCVVLLDGGELEATEKVVKSLRQSGAFPQGVIGGRLAPGYDPADYTQKEVRFEIEVAHIVLEMTEGKPQRYKEEQLDCFFELARHLLETKAAVDVRDSRYSREDLRKWWTVSK